MPRSVAQLPFEIWCQIASFFNIDDIRRNKLYAINRPFLILYLRERYKTLRLIFSCGSFHFSHADPIALSKGLNHTRSLVAENVQTLNVVLEQYSFKSEYEFSPNRILRLIQKHILLRKRIKKLRKSFPTFPEILTAFSQLKNLTTINCVLFTETPPFVFNSQRFLMSGISAAWTSSRATLTCLVLTIQIYPLDDLGLGSITFPHLQQFHLILRSKRLFVIVDRETNSTPPEPLTISAASMAHFLAGHQSTLEILTLTFPINAQQLAADLLNQFPILPSLSNLQLHFTPDGIIRSPSLPFGLFRTLDSHSRSLKDLSLVFDSLFSNCEFLQQEDAQLYRDWWTDQSFERINFPKLESLRLDFDEVIDDTPLLLQFAISSTARSLCLRSRIIQSDIQRLSALYAESKQECRIETLDLSIRTLTPSILSHLAHGFPQIKTLKLHYVCIGLNDWDRDPELFIQGMSNARYSSWSLENVHFFSRWANRHDHQTFRDAVTNAFQIQRVKISAVSPRPRRLRVPRIDKYSL